MVFSREATGRKVTETDSEKHSHLPQDLMILTFSRTKGKETKGSGTSAGLTFFVILGKKRPRHICDSAMPLQRKAAADARSESEARAEMPNLMEKFPRGGCEGPNLY